MTRYRVHLASVRLLPIIAMVMTATMLAGCVIETPRDYHVGWWHHHHDHDYR